MTIKQAELGYFGNIWVRQNLLENVGDETTGHLHYFDHVSLLSNGKVEVEIEGYPPKEFTAPTFIVIRKEHKHKFKALEPNSIWYCVFALRDVNGEVVDDIYGGQHDPKSSSSILSPEILEKLEKLNSKTTTEN